MAALAVGIGDRRCAVKVILAGREVHVVVAGPAGFHRRLRDPVDRVRGRLVAFVMAVAAIADVLREHDVRVVRALDDVAAAGLDARQVRAVVNLVHHHLEVDGVTAVGVRGAGVVAGHAVVGFEAPVPVLGQPVMAVVAGVGLDDLAAQLHAAGRHEVVGRVVHGHEAADLEADAVREVIFVVDGNRIGHVRDVDPVRVLVAAIPVVHEPLRRRGLARGLDLVLGVRALAGLGDLVDVALPGARVTVGARHELGDREAERARGQADQALAALVHEPELHHGRAVHGGVRDLGDDGLGLGDRRQGVARRPGRPRRTRITLGARGPVVAVAARQGEREPDQDRRKQMSTAVEPWVFAEPGIHGAP